MKIPASLTHISNSAFQLCCALTKLTISNGVQSIGKLAFATCYQLENFEIPDSVEAIGNYAFSNCAALTEIVIPTSVISIGTDVFNGCNNLITLTYQGSMAEWQAINDGNGVDLSSSNITSVVCSDGTITY